MKKNANYALAHVLLCKTIHRMFESNTSNFQTSKQFVKLQRLDILTISIPHILINIEDIKYSKIFISTSIHQYTTMSSRIITNPQKN